MGSFQTLCVAHEFALLAAIRSDVSQTLFPALSVLIVRLLRLRNHSARDTLSFSVSKLVETRAVLGR